MDSKVETGLESELRVIKSGKIVEIEGGDVDDEYNNNY